MLQTLMVKVNTDKEQYEKLLKTMHRFNDACNDIANVAFKNRCANKVKLQKIVYYDIRERYGLSAQMTVRAISKVVESYKRNKKIKPTFRRDGAMVYDQRILSWKGIDRVSILTLDGRIELPIVFGQYQAMRMNRIRGQVDLIHRNGTFYLAVVVDVPEEEMIKPVGVLGVDMGIVNIAVDSDGDTYSGEEMDRVRERIESLKADLQRCGTKSAKRHLKKISGREARFRRNMNHCISKELVAKAKDTQSIIALEELGGIRNGTTVRKSQRRRQHSWGFYQLRRFIEYKAALAGIPVVGIDPAYTSQECPVCHHISRKNRPNRDTFRCGLCGFSGHADHIAAMNIAARVTVNLPIVSGFIEHELQEQAPTL
ncbi:transposase [ANME-2 cluster archaeon]|nr:MAG: transposase [ANME-2 cluster archaeon]